MNRFYIIPGVEDDTGIVRVLQTEHNGHTRSVYEERDVPAKRMDYIADAFSRAARELNAIEKQREYTRDAREIREEMEAWKFAAEDDS